VVFKPVPPPIVERFLFPVVVRPVPELPVPDLTVPVPLVLFPPVNLSTTAFVPTPKAAPANALVSVLPSEEPLDDLLAVAVGAVVFAAPEPVEVKDLAGLVPAPVPVDVSVDAGFVALVALVSDGNLDEVEAAVLPVEIETLGATEVAALLVTREVTGVSPRRAAARSPPLVS